MMKKLMTGLIAAASAVVLSSFCASAAEWVDVLVPDYPVVINGIRVNNMHREYPFIWHNGITYFPMTYHDCAFLGVRNEWTRKNGNVITTTESYGEYEPYYDEDGFYNKVLFAVVSEGKITVNGERITNRYSEYPILNFNDVLYFPMTWDWCTEFGWTIEFDNVKGLAVSSNGLSYDGELLEAKDSDIEQLERQLKYLTYAMNDSKYSSYNYDSANASEKGYDLVVGKVYPYLYSELFGTDLATVKTDPSGRFQSTGAYKLPADGVEWIMNNILNCSATRGSYKNNSYYHNGYYYRPIASDGTVVNDIIVKDLTIEEGERSGTYKIGANICYYNSAHTKLYIDSYASATVGIREENGIRYWTFFKYTLSLQKDELIDAYIPEKDKWFMEIAEEYIKTSVYETSKLRGITSMWPDIEYKDGKMYYVIHAVLRVSDQVFSPSVWIYVDSKTGECYHHW